MSHAHLIIQERSPYRDSTESRKPPLVGLRSKTSLGNGVHLRKHQCDWRTAKKRWNYQFLHDRCRLYRMVGKVSHLEGLRRNLPEER